MAKRKNTNKKENKNEYLDKFALFFEHKNSKKSAQNIMILGVTIISIGIVFLFFYTTKTKIQFFSWDKKSTEIKENLQYQWEQSFTKNEQTKNVNEVKQQMTHLIQEIVSTTLNNTTTISTNTALLVAEPTTTLTSTNKILEIKE